MHIPELLAPAGSREAVIAAVENGADAVYFGGEAFSARYDAALSRNDLEWAIDYAHLNSVKTYVTVNTLIKDSELEKAYEYVQFLCNAGADAVIVQDMGILRLIRDQLPHLPVHASTQMTIHNVEGVRFLADMGVERVVLARELSLEDIRRIRAEVTTQLEVFIHGALCFSYSGQCLFSSMIGDKSGNRGYCTQPCRRKYTIDGARGHLLSPKDLDLSGHIGHLIAAGVDAFKIEGRLKRPEYVAGVVRIYRALIDRYLEEPADFRVSSDEQRILHQLFNRGFTSGYLFGNPGGGLMSRKQPHNQGTYLGKVIKYDREKKFAYLHIQQPLRIGDGIGTEGRGTGTTIRSMYINNRSVERTPACATVKIPLDKTVYSNETVFKTYDMKLMESLRSGENRKKIPLTMSFTAKHGAPVELHITDGTREVTLQGDIPGKAKGAPLSQDAVIQQLKKLGHTFFEPAHIGVQLDDSVFIPLSQINSLRKAAVEKLHQELTGTWKRTCRKPEIPEIEEKKVTNKPLLSVHTGSLEALEAAVDNGTDVVYFGVALFQDPITVEECHHAMEYARKNSVEMYLGTPRILKEGYAPSPGPDGYLVANTGVLNSLQRSSTPLIMDYPFNVFNRVALIHFLRYCQRVTLSPELTLDEIAQIARCGPVECIVHGFFPHMVSEHDLLGELFPDDRMYEAVLEDDKGFTYPVRIDGQRRTSIMNSRELCLLKYVSRFIDAGVSCLRVEAGTYDKRTTGTLTRRYRQAIDKGTGATCNGNGSTGHYFKGVL